MNVSEIPSHCPRCVSGRGRGHRDERAADDPEKQVQEHQVLRLRVRPRPDAAERNPLRGGGAPAVDGSIDGIQQASGHIEGVPAATYNLPLSPKLPVASNDSGPLRAKSSEAQGQPQGSAHLELFSFLKERKRRRPTA